MPVALVNNKVPAEIISIGGNLAIRVQPQDTDNLYLAADYTKGTEANVTLTFGIAWPTLTQNKVFNLLSSLNPATDYSAVMSATGTKLIPIPLPKNTEELVIQTNLPLVPGTTGTLNVTITSDLAQVL